MLSLIYLDINRVSITIATTVHSILEKNEGIGLILVSTDTPSCSLGIRREKVVSSHPWFVCAILNTTVHQQYCVILASHRSPIPHRWILYLFKSQQFHLIVSDSSSSSSCRDGPDTSSPQLGVFSGNTALETAYSTSPNVLIRFHSDFSTGGFFILNFHGRETVWLRLQSSLAKQHFY